MQTCPLAYYEILAMLSEAPDRTLPMSDLADRIWLSHGRLSHAVDRLEHYGWVPRISCPADRCGALATLTDAGLAVLAATAPKHVASVRRNVVDRLTPEHVLQLGQISTSLARGRTPPPGPGA